MQTRSKLFLTIVFGAMTVATGFAVTDSRESAQLLSDASSASRSHVPADSHLQPVLPPNVAVPVASKSFVDMLKGAHP